MIRPLAARRLTRTIKDKDHLDAQLSIFANGIGGVFLGMAVLYLAMKIIALVAVERPAPEDKD